MAVAQQRRAVGGIEVDIAFAVHVKDVPAFSARGHEWTTQRGVNACRGRHAASQMGFRRGVQALGLRRHTRLGGLLHAPILTSPERPRYVGIMDTWQRRQMWS